MYHLWLQHVIKMSKKKKYADNVMSPKEYQKMKRNKAANLAMRRKRKGKLSTKRIEELQNK